MNEKNIYQENGFINRNEYLSRLAERYGLSIFTVRSISEIYGEDEDFDALIFALEDYGLIFA
jgi:hypothetical protein